LAGSDARSGGGLGRDEVLEDELCDRLGSVVGDEVHRPSTKAKCGQTSTI
jgi:hypothetical protein